MRRHTLGSHRATRPLRSRWTVGAVALLAALPFAVGQAGATVSHSPSTGGYEIDGNLAPGNDSPTGLDWTGTLAGWTRSSAGVCAGPTTLPILICDPVKSDSTTFPGGAKESDPPGWLPIGASQVTPKTD